MYNTMISVLSRMRSRRTYRTDCKAETYNRYISISAEYFFQRNHIETDCVAEDVIIIVFPIRSITLLSTALLLRGR